MRDRYVGALVLLLLLLLLSGGGYLLFGGPDRESPVPDLPAAPSPLASAPESDPPAPGPGSGEGAEPPPKEPVPAVEPAGEAAAGSVEEARPENAPDAFRRNPRSPPPPKPGQRGIGGGSGGMGPTGGWSKFPPARPSGPATLVARVLDREGEAVAGAEVYLGPPDVAGQSAVSFGDLFLAGKTDESGKLTRGGLPEGGAAAAANLEGLLNGPRGLDARTAVAVVLSASRPASVEIRLPFALSDFGGVRGMVRDPAGEPLRAVSVVAGYRRVYTDGAGRFELPRLPAGISRIVAQRSGYRTESKEIDVVGGAMAGVEFSLAYRESGSLTLAGSVVGPEGEPVPDATVYVIAAAGTGSGTIRSARTDATGQFEMEALPDRLRDVSVRLQANATGYKAANRVFEEGCPGGTVTLRLPERYVRLTLRIVDGLTGAPLDRCRLSARASSSDDWRVLTSTHTEGGEVGAWLSVGPTELLVEAPDHEPHEATLDLAPAGGEVAYTAGLLPAGAPSAEIALTLRLTSAATGDPVRAARIELLPEHGEEPVQRLEATRDDGVFTLPAPSGNWRLSVSADGFETWLDRMDLSPEEKETTMDVRLTPR